MTGETISLTPAVVEFAEKAALGRGSRWLEEVTQATCPPLPDVVHPAGRLGTDTPSKFCENNVALWPRGMSKVTEPRLVESLSCRVQLMLSPQLPDAVKVKGRLTAAPPATSAP